MLSSVLRELRLESAHYRRLELGAPWCIAFHQRNLRGVHIVARGRCELVIEGLPVRALEAGDLVLTPRADPHVLRSPGAKRSALVPSTELAAGTQGGVIRAGGPGEQTIVVCGAFVFHEADHPALAGLPRVIHVAGESGRAPAWLETFVSALIAEARDLGPGGEVIMARLSDALVARALRHHADQAEEPGLLRGLGDPFVARALALLHDDVAHGWTLARLARSAGLSRAAFAARFSEVMGDTPMRYLLRRRMRRAIELLRDERRTLLEVAASVGYGSEAAFSAAFKRHTGQAPGAYARANRKS